MRAMFSTVAPRYDFITRTFSYGMDRRWKRTGLERANLPERPVVLDLASGTGDFSLMVQPALPRARAVAVDITERMLQLARERGVQHTVCGDAGLLPFPDGSFDCVFVGYGLRNFPNLDVAVQRNRTRHPSRRLTGQPGFLPACQSAAAPALSRLPLRAGRLLGHCAPRPAAGLHLHPRFAAHLRLDRRFFVAAAPHGLPARWMRAATSWAASACTGRSKSKLVAGIHQPG